MADSTFTVEIQGLKELGDSINRISSTFPGVLKLALTRAARSTQQAMQSKAPAASGKLRQSVTVDYSNLGRLEVEIGPDEEYGLYQEKRDNLSQRTPPIEKIKEWALAKGLGGDKRDDQLAFLIARKIAAQGYPAQPFVEPTVPFAKSQLLAEANIALIDALRRL